MSALADLEREYLAALERIKELEAQVAMHVRSLRALVVTDIPAQLRVTPKEAKLLLVLVSRPMATKEQLLAEIYADRYQLGDEPYIKIIDVFVCKLRNKLPADVKIETLWGRGYRLPPESKQRLREMCDEAIRPPAYRDNRGHLHAV